MKHLQTYNISDSTYQYVRDMATEINTLDLKKGNNFIVIEKKLDNGVFYYTASKFVMHFKGKKHYDVVTSYHLDEEVFIRAI